MSNFSFVGIDLPNRMFGNKNLKISNDLKKQ